MCVVLSFHILLFTASLFGSCVTHSKRNAVSTLPFQYCVPFLGGATQFGNACKTNAIFCSFATDVCRERWAKSVRILVPYLVVATVERV